MIGFDGFSQLIRIRIRIGIGIGIELTDPVFPKRLADRVATLSALRQLSHTTIERRLLLPVVVCGHHIAHRQHVLNRRARQRRAACDFNIPASVPVRRFRRLPENDISDRAGFSFAFKERRREHSRAM
jgi:hypothetical protein